MFITILVHKGGAGKTTTAVNLAAAFALRGRPTTLVDIDRLQIGATHYKDGIENVVYTQQFPEDVISDHVIVVDTPPTINNEIGKALSQSDLVIVMASPDGAILREIPQTLKNIEKVLSKLPNAKARVLFSYVTKTKEMEGILEASKAFSPVPLFKTTIPERKVDMKKSGSAAKSIVNLDPNSKISQAYRALAEEIEVMFNVVP